MSIRILNGDCREVLRTLDAGSVQCCVTSPPYFGLRSYGIGTENGEIGLEPTPDEFIAAMVEVFREVRRVLADDGTLWLNLGDSYGVGKQLLGVPWRVALAMQADRWLLRQDIIWHKPAVIPESVRDRCTKAHEYIFLFAKSGRYFFDNEAIKEPALTFKRQGRSNSVQPKQAAVAATGARNDGEFRDDFSRETANKRSVWSVTPSAYRGAHFATFPPALIEPCIKAGSRPGDTVLDPFGGAGTTGLVADRLGRHALLIELNPDYAALARDRIHGDAPLFAEVVA